MHNALDISELNEFINNTLNTNNPNYTKAFWLKVNFECNEWYCVFGNHSCLTINFNIKVGSDHLLTSQAHQILLKTIKHSIIHSAHPDANNGKLLGAAASAYNVRDTLQIFDYFLINSETFGIDKDGLKYITTDDLRRILTDLASASRKQNSIYCWPEKLSAFLREKISTQDPKSFVEIVKAYPWLAENIPPEDDRVLNLTENEIVKARCWLWANNFYKNATNNQSATATYTYQIKTVALSEIIYKNTLRGQTQKSQFDELRVRVSNYFNTEYPAAPVSCLEDNRLSESNYIRYLRTIRSIDNCTKLLNLPSFAGDLPGQHFFETINTKEKGRFKTLPSSTVFNSLRVAIDFIIQYGDVIVDSALISLERIRDAPIDNQYSTPFLLSSPIKEHRLPNIQCWSLIRYRQRLESNLPPPPYYDQVAIHQRIRNHEGLYELILVLYGAVQVCIGTLMARRQGELIDLIAGRALDKTGKFLIFDNRKSGFLELRKKEARPIPPIGARAVKLLERFQAGLLELRLINEYGPLFAFPTIEGDGLVKVCVATYNRALNFFCDYSETSLDPDGRRYYIRQHQLRRFFAMLFFWGKSFGGMDTLRWFLGQSDAEHLYHYITENTPGEVLQSVKVQYILDRISDETVDIGDMRDLVTIVEQHFGTKDFSVLDDDELEDYLNILVHEKKLIVEPEFINCPDGKSYRIIVKVLSVETQDARNV